MIKTSKQDNRLNILKRKNLLKLMKEKGLTRVSPEALKIFSEKISEDVEKLICRFKQSIQIKAKKTLGKQDVLETIQKRNAVENYDF